MWGGRYGRAEGSVAAFAYPESAARALGRAAERAEWLRRPHGAVPALAGIGRATALTFARHGARLVLAARRAEVLTEVAAEWPE